MKKLTCMILLIQCGFMTAQTKTMVTMYGEKVQINPNSLVTANNGLTATNGNVQLGGSLTLPITTVAASATNSLAISGLQTSVSGTDNLIVADPATGILKTLSPSSLNNGWLLKGNIGTTVSTTSTTSNFMGTTDNTAINFRVNNVQAGWIGTEPGAGMASVYFGINAGLAGAGLSGATSNVGIGNNALAANTGNSNIAIGANSLQNSTTGAYNTGVGYLSLRANTSGGGNTAIGSSAFQNNTSGINNTALGNNTGYNNTIGNYNTFIGNSADLTTSGLNVTNATAIGYNAKVGQSNSIILGGTGANAVKVGIGNTTPANTLHVKSTANPVRFEGMLQSTTLESDVIVVTDANGVLKTNNMAFSAKVPLVISSTGTTPRIATVTQNNFMRYRFLPNNQVEIDFLYSALSGSGGADGIGDYVFNVPFIFDSTEHPVYTGSTNNGLPYASIIRDCKVVFASASGVPNQSINCYIVPYNQTQFRIIGNFSPLAGSAVGSSTIPLSSNNVTIGGRFTFTWSDETLN